MSGVFSLFAFWMGGAGSVAIPAATGLVRINPTPGFSVRAPAISSTAGAPSVAATNSQPGLSYEAE